MLKLSELKVGQEAQINTFTDVDLSIKLLEMGCLPGGTVKMQWVAPLGDPIGILVSGYCLSLRKNEAATVLVSCNS